MAKELRENLRNSHWIKILSDLGLNSNDYLHHANACSIHSKPTLFAGLYYIYIYIYIYIVLYYIILYIIYWVALSYSVVYVFEIFHITRLN
jgi:hypothetical protein